MFLTSKSQDGENMLRKRADGSKIDDDRGVCDNRQSEFVKLLVQYYINCGEAYNMLSSVITEFKKC